MPPIEGRRTARQAIQLGIIAVAALMLTAATMRTLLRRGGPYLDTPPTVMRHVQPTRHEIDDALVVVPLFAQAIPRGAQVTCFRPVGGESHNDQNFVTTVGLLPRHEVLPPFTALRSTPRESLVEYVIAIRDPFTHPDYELLAEHLPEGRLYKVKR